MEKVEQIQLVKATYGQDEIGQEIKTETTTTIIANIQSISQEEFYKAAQAGLKAKYKLIIFAPEYNGEQVVIYDGKRYQVYRTYEARNEKLELYVEDQEGA